MPIRIDKKIGGERKEVAWLCDNEFDLRVQFIALNEWLLSKAGDLELGDYCADVGFNPREGAAGGGATLSGQALTVMSKVGMSLEISEYPPFVDN